MKLPYGSLQKRCIVNNWDKIKIALTTVLLLVFLTLVIASVIDRAINRHKCSLCGERQYEKLITHRYSEDFEGRFGKRCFSLAFLDAQLELATRTPEGEVFDMNSPAIQKRTWEILRSRK